VNDWFFFALSQACVRDTHKPVQVLSFHTAQIAVRSDSLTNSSLSIDLQGDLVRRLFPGSAHRNKDWTK
jgi:hypothetical protein